MRWGLALGRRMHSSHFLPNHSMFLKRNRQALAHQSEVEGKSIKGSEPLGEEQSDRSAKEDKVSVLGEFLQMQIDLNWGPADLFEKKKKAQPESGFCHLKMN